MNVAEKTRKSKYSNISFVLKSLCKSQHDELLKKLMKYYFGYKGYDALNHCAKNIQEGFEEEYKNSICIEKIKNILLRKYIGGKFRVRIVDNGFIEIIRDIGSLTNGIFDILRQYDPDNSTIILADDFFMYILYDLSLLERCVLYIKNNMKSYEGKIDGLNKDLRKYLQV